MVEKVEGYLHTLRAVWNYGSRQAPCIDVQGRVPRVVQPRRASEPIFADNLGVQVECRTSLAPGFIGDFGPHGAEALSISGGTDRTAVAGYPQQFVIHPTSTASEVQVSTGDDVPIVVGSERLNFR